MIIGKTYTFSAAHCLPGHPKCGQRHGHTYHVKIEIEGAINKEGFVIDFGILNKYMEKLISIYDHTDLNTFMESTTCESIASVFLHTMLESIPHMVLQFKSLSVEIKEGEGGYARAVYSLKD